MGCLTGLEPAASGATIRRSNHLSYRQHRGRAMRTRLVSKVGVEPTVPQGAPGFEPDASASSATWTYW